jgi:HTTM domain
MSDRPSSPDPPPSDGERLATIRRDVAHHLGRVLTLDVRSLAMARMALGALIVWDVAVRLNDVSAHYTDAGFLPRAAQGQPPNPLLSLYFHSGTAQWAQGLLWLTGALGVFLALGLFTRAVCVLAWLLLASLNARNHFVCNAGDFLLVNVMFWMSFLPLGARWGVDAWRRRGRAPPPQRVAGVPAIALYAQLAALYLVSGIAKAGFPHWWRGEGLSYALAADHYVSPLGRWVAGLWGVPQLLTWATLIIEIPLALALILLPASVRLRTALAAVFISLHLGIEVTLGIGLFSYIAIATWLATIPSGAMDRIEGWLSRQPRATDGSAPGAACPRPLAIFVAVALAYLLALTGLRGRVPNETLRTLRMPLRVLSLGDSWTVFTGPREYSGWYVAPIDLDDGTTLDAITGAPVSWERPADVRALWSNPRWRKLYTNFPKPKRRHALRLYLSWLCRTRPEVWRVRYVYMRHAIHLDGSSAPTERHQAGLKQCRARRPTRRR